MPPKKSHRKTTSIKVDPKLNKQFMKTVVELGMDQCFVEDTFRRVFLDGIEATKKLDPKALSEQAIHPLIIHIDNPHYHYQVLRPRRRKKWTPEEECVVHYNGSPEKCSFCAQKPAYMAFTWVTRTECNRLWLCVSCFEQARSKHTIQGWREL